MFVNFVIDACQSFVAADDGICLCTGYVPVKNIFGELRFRSQPQDVFDCG